MKFAVLRNRDFLRYELDDVAPLEFGARRYPVETDPKPSYDPATEYLDSAPALDPARNVVRILYAVHMSPPRIEAPAGGTVIMQADTSGLEAAIAELRAKHAEMAAAPAKAVNDLMLAFVAVEARAGSDAARAELAPIAAARRVSVDQLIDDMIALQQRARGEALKGAA